jgi:hypothetical protein
MYIGNKEDLEKATIQEIPEVSNCHSYAEPLDELP